MGADWHPRLSAPKIMMLLRRIMGLILISTLIPASLLAGWHVWRNTPYTTDSDLAYNLGLIGALLMLSLFIYPLRKRIRLFRYLGPLRHWFRFHMLAGVLGPLLVLFHSTFRVHSLNAGIALASMLLVVSSGLVGRLIYRRIHRGLYGRRLTLLESKEFLEKQLVLMRESPDLPGEIMVQLEQFTQLVSATHENRLRRAAHFLTLGFRRRSAGRRARRTLKRYARASVDLGETHLDLPGMVTKIEATLKVAQTTAQFATFERLFSYWHAVHIPFLFMLLVTAVVHVVAVHAY